MDHISFRDIRTGWLSFSRSRLVASALAALTFLFLMCSMEKPASGATVAAASKTPWVYWYTNQANFGVNAGCYNSDIDAANAGIALYGHCDKAFSAWDNPWPNTSGSTQSIAQCPAPDGLPSLSGWDHLETRAFNWTYHISNSLGCGPDEFTTTGDLVSREYYYYCPDPGAGLDNFGAGNEPFCDLQTDALKQPPCDKCTVSDPINVANKWHYESETDYVGVGPMPLRFERHYWANTWRNNFQRSVAFAKFANLQTSFNIASVFRTNGQRITFVQHAGSTSFSPDSDIATSLSGTFDGNGNPTGWTYKDLDDSIETYDGAGRLTSVKSRSGLMQVLNYNSAGMLASVVDDFGHQLTFGYNNMGQLAAMTDPNGKDYTYTYDASGNLTSVQFPDGSTRSYSYNEVAYSAAGKPGFLTGVFDENNQRFTSLYYDSTGAATQSAHAGGADAVAISYNRTELARSPTRWARAAFIRWFREMTFSVWVRSPVAAAEDAI